MNVTTILSGLLAVSVGVAAAAPASKRAATDELTANRERDTYAIAEQLYRQGHVAGLDDATRKNILTRVCELQQTFVKDFPNSPLKTKALYMRATCAEEIGQKELSREVYKELTSAGKEGKKDDFVASAAYKLATYHFNRALNYADSAQSLQEAAQNYALVEKFSTNNQLVYDARYRRARVYTLLAQNQSGKAAAESQKSALSLYEKYFKTNSPDVPAHIQGAAHYAYAQLLTDIGGDDNLRTALEQFELFLGAANENEQQRSIATLQAARICTKINQPDKAAAYYEELEKFSNMKDYGGETKMEIIMALFQAGKVDEIRTKYPNDMQNSPFLKEIRIPQQRAACAGILGQVYMQNKDYVKAAGFFQFAEQEAMRTSRGADAGYRLIVCLQQIQNGRAENEAAGAKLPDLSAYGMTYLNLYGTDANPETKDLQCTNLARVIYADHMMKSDKKNAWTYYRDVDMDNLPDYLVEDTAYKKAWSLFVAWSEQKTAENSPKEALDFYVEQVSAPTRLADVLCMRGNYFFESKIYEAALADYRKVIDHHQDTAAYPVCLQRAAHACMNCQPPQTEQAKTYFRDLLKYASETGDNAETQGDGSNISKYAAAEANFNLGRLCYQDETEAAIEYFKAAKELNDKSYAASASVCLIQCYFKLKNTHKQTLLKELPLLKKNYPAQYKALSKAVPRWCGWAWYNEAQNQLENYRLAVEYLNDSVDREKTEEYTTAEGETKLRPVAEAVVWLTLARSCLEIEQYASTETLIGGLDAIDYYLSMEADPHRRADGLKTKAMLLNGHGEPAKAMELCSEALNLGVNGPVLSSIRLVAGDSAYLMGDYEKASQLYGLVANFDRNNDLNREALYKAAYVLRLNGKEAEADNYDERLKAKLKELGIDSKTPLQGLVPSISRHFSAKSAK